ncbi:hypothetical protein L0P88_21990 [Muricauda sp. SCSIO 64092]|uniref:hypothetical protein n=1 Tax=Allomuricauda sp. SCSIO 64092 TaxID=2908842 RepID=UPI001FF5F45B|nr:hypothetical protein [Muricauda sp. SCSIO 64092]UOY06581.1 hypothetical protein L0P88_21990 [Muricauda sp. SCSIO 64092]
MKPKNRKEYIAKLLTLKGAFRLVKTEKNNQTHVEYYESTTNKSCFEAGYVNDVLIYLNLSNEDVPGYTEHHRGEYFFDSDFDHKRQSKTGLTFDEVNRKGIKEELECGLIGQEEQYLLNQKVIYSKLYLTDEHFVVNVDLSGRTFWQKLFGPEITNIEGVTVKTIDLKGIFSGI